MSGPSIVPGTEQIYRLSEFTPSERVRVLAIDQRKKTPRYDVEFLDGEKAGTVENVPAGRLRGSWSEVEGYDEYMAHWQRFLDEEPLDSTEDGAIEHVFLEVVPGSVAELSWKYSRWTAIVKDRAALAALIGVAAGDVLDQLDYFEDGAAVVMSPESTMRLAAAIVHANPAVILDWVVEDEEKYRELCKRGRSGTGRAGYATSPEQEYDSYLRYGRPLHELLRAWCGHRAVTLQERIDAAEAEVRRLDELLARVIDELKAHEHSYVAEIIEQEHVEGRITPATVRPVVDRPLKPSEMPVVEVPVRRRRWW